MPASLIASSGGGLDTPALTVALAMLMGLLAQTLARHLRLPGLVVLLAAGLGLGPDGANLIRPANMGEGLATLVGFAVAVILFEGGLHLDLQKLRKQAKPIRRLVIWGSIITTAGGAAAARFIMGWDWRLSLLFGTLVIVTGPTVINPLLQRLRLDKRIATILEAEGIFIDAVGATIATVGLEVALAPSASSFGHGVIDIATRLGIGALIGLTGGGLFAALLWFPKVIPRGLVNVLALGFAVAIFQVSDSVLHESGITAAIVAGMVVGNLPIRALKEIVDFKEQMVTLLIATLFVLLAADVRIADIQGLGVRSLALVAALMFLVRPMTVFASTIRTDLGLRRKLYLSWLAPRGIVAAAVASLFAVELAEAKIEGGLQLRAMVFMVIAVTVTVQGLLGGPVAWLLGVRQATRTGYLFLGANPLAIQLAKHLRDAGEEVTLIDQNADAVQAAEKEGFKVVYGNGLQERTIRRAGVAGVCAAVGVTENENANFLFAKLVAEGFPAVRTLVALESEHSGVTRAMVEEHDMSLLFTHLGKLRNWIRLLDREVATVERWRVRGPVKFELGDAPQGLLAVGGMRGTKPFVVSGSQDLQDGDELTILFDPGRDEAARSWLAEHAWERVEDVEPVEAETEGAAPPNRARPKPT